MGKKFLSIKNLAKSRSFLIGTFLCLVAILLPGYLLIKLSEKKEAVTNLIQGESVILLSLITGFYAWQTKRLVKATKESVNETKESIKKQIETRELDFLERRLTNFYEPVNSSFNSLIANMNTYISGVGDISFSKHYVTEALDTIWKANEKYGYMISETVGNPLRDKICKCLDMMTGNAQEDSNIIDELTSIHLAIVAELHEIRKYIRSKYSAVWLELKEGK